MTTPEGPTGSQPASPQPSAIPPSQPGWAALPPQPGAVPPPPPGYQPGWGAPPPQQTWGGPPPPGYQPAWGQSGWPPPQQPTSHKARNGCLIGCGAAVAVLIALIVVVAIVAAQLLGPALDTSMKIQQNSHGQVSSSSYQWTNGVGEFRIWLAPGVPNSQGDDVACNVVRPTLKGTKFEGTNFVIFGNNGRVVADETTPCG
jgi:hypothetical protein